MDPIADCLKRQQQQLLFRQQQLLLFRRVDETMRPEATEDGEVPDGVTLVGEHPPFAAMPLEWRSHNDGLSRIARPARRGLLAVLAMQQHDRLDSPSCLIALLLKKGRETGKSL